MPQNVLKNLVLDIFLFLFVLNACILRAILLQNVFEALASLVREHLSRTAAVVLWILSMDSWWSAEQRSSSLTGETETLQCHCFWMNLAVVGESASCQNIWVRPHTVFKIVIVSLFLGSICLDSSFICMAVSLLLIDFSFILVMAIADLDLFVKLLHNIYTGKIQTCYFQTSVKIREQILKDIKAEYLHSSDLVSLFLYSTPFSRA